MGKMKGKGVGLDSKCAGVKILEIKSFSGSSRSGLAGRAEFNQKTCLINFSLPYAS